MLESVVNNVSMCGYYIILQAQICKMRPCDFGPVLVELKSEKFAVW